MFLDTSVLKTWLHIHLLLMITPVGSSVHKASSQADVSVKCYLLEPSCNRHSVGADEKSMASSKSCFTAQLCAQSLCRSSSLATTMLVAYTNCVAAFIVSVSDGQSTLHVIHTIKG